jgi:hypothetical protein
MPPQLPHDGGWHGPSQKVNKGKTKTIVCASGNIRPMANVGGHLKWRLGNVGEKNCGACCNAGLPIDFDVCGV